MKMHVKPNRVIWHVVVFLFMADQVHSIVDILETDSFPLYAIGGYVPNARNRKVKRLRRILGSYFDPEWMSIERPKQDNGVPDTHDTGAHMDNAVSATDNSRQIKEWLHSHSSNQDVNNQTETQAVSYLQRISTCRLTYEWHEQPELYWPRYVRRGTCISRGSCSWPAGMTCKPDHVNIVQSVKVLRWICKNKSRASQRKRRQRHKNRTQKLKNSGRQTASVRIGGKIKCSWKRVPFDALTGCICTC